MKKIIKNFEKNLHFQKNVVFYKNINIEFFNKNIQKRKKIAKRDIFLKILQNFFKIRFL